MWAASGAGSDLNMVESRLAGFNDLLYDCTDGQWRIARFLIHDTRNEMDPESDGTGHLHRTGTHGPHGHADGRPNKPEHWHVNENSASGTYLMEFLHSWTGMKDEYEKKDGSPAECPASNSDATANSACVMDETTAGWTEMCRPATHNPVTEQGQVRGMSCYSWMDKVFADSGRPAFQVPSSHITGPTTAPTVRWVYLTITRVQRLSGPDPFGGAGDYYAKVRMDGAWFTKSKHKDNDNDVSPNWLFGLGYSRSTAKSIAVRLEIYDHDWPSADDMCDVAPASGRKYLSFTISPTGSISGDISGSAGSNIAVSGAGDSDRVRVTLRVNMG